MKTQGLWGLERIFDPHRPYQSHAAKELTATQISMARLIPLNTDSIILRNCEPTGSPNRHLRKGAETRQLVEWKCFLDAAQHHVPSPQQRLLCVPDLTGGEVSGYSDHVADRQFFYHRFHHVRPCPCARPILHVEKLAHDVARKAPCDSGNAAEAQQVRAVAIDAGDGLAITVV